MLADKDAMATIAVRDLAAAKNFTSKNLVSHPPAPKETVSSHCEAAIRQLLSTSHNLPEPTRPRLQLGGSAQK